MKHLLIYFTDTNAGWIKKAMGIIFVTSTSLMRAPDDRAAMLPALAAPSARLRLLLSYHYFKKVDLDKMLAEFSHPPGQVFADSGAFSAKTLGAEITIADYAAWLKRWRHWFGPMANLDVIGDPVGTARNQQELDDFKRWLDETVDHRHLNEIAHFRLPPRPTTAENLARWLFGVWSGKFPELAEVQVSETPRTWASYRP